MNEKILTWVSKENSGAFQKNTEYGIFSDLMTEKPKLSFDFTELNYNQMINVATIDNNPLTEEQIVEILNFINDYKINDQFIFNNKVSGYYNYLFSTDWYVIRKMDQDIEIPNIITEKRKFAREQISSIRDAMNITTGVI